MAEPRKIDLKSLVPRLERAFEFAAHQVVRLIERDPDFFPIYTRNGRWRHDGEGWTDWCAGFHAGMMWLLAGRSGELEWRQRGRTLHAAARTQAVRPRRPRPGFHLLEHVSSLVSLNRRCRVSRQF